MSQHASDSVLPQLPPSLLWGRFFGLPSTALLGEWADVFDFLCCSAVLGAPWVPCRGPCACVPLCGSFPGFFRVFTQVFPSQWLSWDWDLPPHLLLLVHVLFVLGSCHRFAYCMLCYYFLLIDWKLYETRSVHCRLFTTQLLVCRAAWHEVNAQEIGIEYLSREGKHRF